VRPVVACEGVQLPSPSGCLLSASAADVIRASFGGHCPAHWLALQGFLRVAQRGKLPFEQPVSKRVWLSAQCYRFATSSRRSSSSNPSRQRS
jgi:hypothetical protein